MQPIFSRSSARFVFPALCAAAAFGVLSITGCGDKSPTEGAYGEAATNAPAPPSAASPAATVPVTAASPMATMPTPDGGDKSGGSPVAPPLADNSKTAAPPMGNAPFAGGGSGGPMMGGGDPNAPLTATPDMDKKIARLLTGSDKKALAAAYADRGFARMNDENAGAKVKYRKALEDYRAALQNDPTNTKAKENKELIEGIYRNMGRPIPGEEGPSAKK